MEHTRGFAWVKIPLKRGDRWGLSTGPQRRLKPSPLNPNPLSTEPFFFAKSTQNIHKQQSKCQDILNALRYAPNWINESPSHFPNKRSLERVNQSRVGWALTINDNKFLDWRTRICMMSTNVPPALSTLHHGRFIIKEQMELRERNTRLTIGLLCRMNNIQDCHITRYCSRRY